MHDNGEHPMTAALKRLSGMLDGERGHIVRIGRTGPRGIRQRLLDMGITRGAEVLVVRRAPMGDPIEVVVKNYHLALREKEAALIEVEPVVS